MQDDENDHVDKGIPELLAAGESILRSKEEFAARKAREREDARQREWGEFYAFVTRHFGPDLGRTLADSHEDGSEVFNPDPVLQGRRLVPFGNAPILFRPTRVYLHSGGTEANARWDVTRWNADGTPGRVYQSLYWVPVEWRVNVEDGEACPLPGEYEGTDSIPEAVALAHRSEAAYLVALAESGRLAREPVCFTEEKNRGPDDEDWPGDDEYTETGGESGVPF